MPAEVEVLVEDKRWEQINLQEIAELACTAVLDLSTNSTTTLGVALLACCDERIRELNSKFRGQQSATNVLSWPANREYSESLKLDPSEPSHLGDMALAWETCTAESTSLRRSFDSHVSHLIVHACLHLLGFRHDSDKEAEEMQVAEVKVLATIGIPSPYSEVGVRQV